MFIIKILSVLNLLISLTVHIFAIKNTQIYIHNSTVYLYRVVQMSGMFSIIFIECFKI